MKLRFLMILSLVIISVLAYNAAAAVNEGNKTIKLTPILDSSIYLNTEYTALFKIEIKNKDPCSSPKDSVTVLYNISKDNILVKEDSFTKEIGCTSSASTGSFIPAEIGNYTLCGMIINTSVSGNVPSNLTCKPFTVLSTEDISCDVSLQLKVNETIFYENGQSIEFKPELNNKSFPFVIEYWVEDLFGTVVKPKINTTNTNEKSWKTNIQEQDRVLFLNAVVHPSCADSDPTNNVARKMFIVTKNDDNEDPSSAGSEENIILNSTINVTKIAETVSFGELLDPEIEIYKAATDKYSVSIWAEKDGKEISEKSKVHLKNKNTLYKFMLPVQIEPNCGQKIEGGTAQLIVEGLGLHTQKEFSLQGINDDLCPEKGTGSGSKPKNTVKIIDLPAEITSGETVPVKLEINNDGDQEFEAWSYLYRGSKCYSCAAGGRDENKISFSVDEGEIKTVKMLVKIDLDLEQGEYNLMVKYRKADQKTEKTISEKIFVITKEKVNAVNQSLSLLSTPEESEPVFSSRKVQATELPEYSGIVVYESTAGKTKNLISWFLAAALGLLCLILIIRKEFT